MKDRIKVEAIKINNEKEVGYFKDGRNALEFRPAFSGLMVLLLAAIFASSYYLMSRYLG